VHHRAVSDHLLQVALRHRHEPDHDDVADAGQRGQVVAPVQGAEREQRQRDLDEAVEPELLQDAGMEHRGRARRGPVAERRPGMERPEGDEDPEAEEQDAEDVLLRHLAEGLRGQRVAQRHEVEAVGAALRVDGDQAESESIAPTVR
jgi:hypothetical protein